MGKKKGQLNTMGRKNKKRTHLAWNEQNIKFPLKQAIEFENFTLNAEILKNDEVQISIESHNGNKLEFRFESYALEPEEEELIYSCNPKGKFSKKLKLGSYFTLCYR